MHRQILLSIVIRFLLYFVHWMVLAHLPVLLKQYGLTDIQIGTVIGLLSLSSMGLMLPMGAFSDFFSPKRTILLGALLFGIYFYLLLKVRSFGSLLPTIFIGGFGTAALIVVTESLYLKLFGQEKRGRRVAIYQLSTYMGFGLGPLAGGIILHYNPDWLFQIAIAGSAMIFVLGLFLADYEPIVFSFKKYGEDIVQFKPLLLIACIFVLGTHFGVEQTSFSLFMKEELGFLPQTIGIVFAGIGLWMAFAVPFIGRLHDSRQTVFLFFLGGLAISAIFQILTAWAFDFWSLLVIRLIHTLGDAIALLELSVLVAMLFPSHRLGGNSGVLYAIRTMATFLAAFASGWFNRQWGYGASFLANGIFVLLFVVVSVVFIRTSIERMQSVGWVRKSG